MKKCINNILIGIGISCIITTVYMFFYARYGTGQEIFNVYLIWMGFGTIAGIISLIFSLKIHMIIKYTIHIIILSLSWYMSMYYTLKIFKIEFNIPLTAILLFIIIYVFISFCFGLAEKKKIDELNKKFQN